MSEEFRIGNHVKINPTFVNTLIQKDMIKHKIEIERVYKILEIDGSIATISSPNRVHVNCSFLINVTNQFQDNLDALKEIL